MDRYQEVNSIAVQAECTPLEFVYAISRKHFRGALRIGEIDRSGADAYSRGILYLSTETIHTPSVASFTIAAHELGHALQDKEGRKLKTLAILRSLGRVLAFLLAPCFIAGAVLAIFEYFVLTFVLLGCGLLIFLLALYVKLRTISIEKDASEKALSLLEEYLSENELKISKSFLKDAKLTYWADFLRMFLWWTALSRKTKLFN